MASPDWRKMSLRLLAVFMAVVLWVYVTNEQNPVNEQIFKIPLSQSGMPENHVVSGIPSHVSVRAQGTRTQISGLTQDDFKAALDLSGIKVGDNGVQVEVTSPPGIRISQVSPARVQLVVDLLVEKQIPVTANLRGVVAQGYSHLEAVVQPGAVTVKGPKKLLDGLLSLAVTVDIGSAAGLVEQTLPVGDVPAGVSVNPRNVKVTIPVTPTPSKTVVVEPGTDGKPAEGYEISGYTIKPEGVEVVAPASVLSELSGVELEKIDVSGATSDITLGVKVIKPAGAVEVRPGTVEVTVLIKAIARTPGGVIQ